MMTAPADLLSVLKAVVSTLWRSRHPRLPVPVGQNSDDHFRHIACQAHLVKYSSLPKFGFDVQATYPGPRQGADRDRHEPRAGQRWTRRLRHDRHCRAASAVSNGLRACDTMPKASSHGFGCEHTPALEATCEDVRGRTSRVVLTPGVCGSSPAVMWRPDRARASVIRKATGAIVHRSPGRARRTR
jgi:hypothetical protein